VYDYIASFDVPRAFALTGATALLATILGDRIGFYFEDENEDENEGEMIFANDFFIQIADTGSGKSFASKRVRSLLRTIDKKILKPDGKHSELLYFNVATARGLIERIRHESDVERIRREADERAAEKSGQAPPPKRTPQTSGLWLIDEFDQLLKSFKREFNVELSSIILSLWDNTEFSHQTKSDGVFEVPQTSITILGNSIPETFWQDLPELANRNGFLQRMLIVATTESREKTMLEVMYTKTKNVARNVARNVLCKDLLEFYHYCAGRPPVKFLYEECMPVEREFRRRNQSSDKDIKRFLTRLNVRLLKFSVIVATCKAFETRAPEIVIDARTMEQASALLDFFVRSTINFIKAMTLDGQKPIDAVGKTKVRMLSLLREKFSGEVRRKVLRDYSNVSNQLFEKALAELVESGKAQIVERNVRGQKSVFVRLTAKFTSPFSTSPCNNNNRNSTETQNPEKLGKKGENPATSPLLHPTSPFEINTTVTQPQPQKGEKGEVKKGEVTTVPEPVNPEPMPVVEPEPEPTQPMPEPPEPEPTPPMPAPPEPEPTVPEPEHVQKIASLVLRYLEDFWSCKKIPGEPFRRYVAKISGRYENAVWKLLFPAHIVKLHTTDFFILREDKHRPKGFEGLIDDKGVLPCDEPAPF